MTIQANNQAELNTSLNSQLASHITWNEVVSSGNYIFVGGPSMEVISFAPDINLGICRSFGTGFLVAFRLGKEAQPRACRQYQRECCVSMIEIETIANADCTGVEAELGGQFLSNRWRKIW